MLGNSLETVKFFAAVIVLGFIAVAFAVYMFDKIKNKLGNINMLNVYKEPDLENMLPGVPFYVKKGQLTHETSYLEKLISCTLTKKKVILGDQNEPIQHDIEIVGVKTFSQSSENKNNFTTMCEKLAQAQQEKNSDEQLKHWEQAWDIFDKRLTPYEGKIPTKSELQIEGNELKQSNFVDYSNIYYFNKQQPLIGSSNLEIELAADGTLTKTMAQSQDSTFEKLLELLPIDSLISKTKPETEIPQIKHLREVDEKEIAKYEFSLATEQMYVRHIFFNNVSFSETKFLLPLDPLKDRYWYRREVITDLRKKTKENESIPMGSPEKAEDKTSITLAGSPEEKQESK